MKSSGLLCLVMLGSFGCDGGAAASPGAAGSSGAADTPCGPVAAFEAPATATPTADFSVDRGLTHYRTTPALNAKTTLIESYNWQSKYLDAETWDLDADSHIQQSDRCVVEYEFSDGTRCYPITLGNYALEKYSIYVADTPDASAARDKFFQAADWFVGNQDERGGWGTEFDDDWWPQRAARLEAGWYSGMAQGLAISVLVRAFFVSHDARYLEAARKSVAVLRTPVDQGGVMRCISGHVFYEEYPTEPMSNVLNGYLFAVIGLYDLAQVTTEPEYDQYFQEAVTTVEALISRYDLGGFTAYDLSHLQHPGEYPNRARWGYHTLHVTQLSWLRAATGDEFFSPIITRWAGYTDGKPVPEN